MSERRPLGRRKYLLGTLGLALPTGVAGCIGSDEDPPAESNADSTAVAAESQTAESDTGQTADLFGERPYPAALVGAAQYVTALAEWIERARFPDPDPDLVPALTKARFVVEAATQAGEVDFAEQVRTQREPVLEPLRRYDAVVTLVSEARRERLSADERAELRSLAGLDDEDVSWDDGRQAVLEATLDERALTFFDYPGPPGHVIEAAHDRGRDSLDRDPDERATAVDEDPRPYVRQRATVEAVVTGGRDLAAAAFDEHVEQIRAASPSERDYGSPEEYARVVAFNAALAAESMLAEDGELVTPP